MTPYTNENAFTIRLFSADGLCVRHFRQPHCTVPSAHILFRNKAVLVSSPDLPLLFLLVQLVIAVILLHASSFMSEKVEIPKMDLDSAQKLFPVVFVNVVGLVFNTLCLRDVEASFFQVLGPYRLFPVHCAQLDTG